jgi:glycosyltransferase involved in cell wall biosynthesis
MKIAVFHNLPLGGGKRTLFEQMKALSKKHELFLFEFSSTDESFLDVRPFAKKVFRYKFNVKSNLPFIFARLEKDFQNFVKLGSVHKKIAERINRGNYDVALVHADRFTQAPFILRFLKIPSLYFCQEYLRIVYEKELEFKKAVILPKRIYELLTRKIRRIIDRSNAKTADLILANSRFTQRNIKKAYGKESVVCHLGVDPRVFKPAKTKENKLLFIGEKNEASGYGLIKEAVSSIPSKIRPTLTSAGVSLGKLKIRNDKTLAKEYATSMVTLCASHNEPFGLAPIESMACGTPVLAVNEGGYRETIQGGKTGYLLKRDPKEFANKIVYLTKHPEIAKGMGEAGRKQVIKNFSWEKHLKKVEQGLSGIVKK